MVSAFAEAAWGDLIASYNSVRKRKLYPMGMIISGRGSVENMARWKRRFLEQDVSGG
jgi:hypothetical protein